MKIKRIEHIAIAVKNMKQSQDVFGTTLGMDLEYEEYMPQYRTRLAMYPVGETYIELLEAEHEDTETARWISQHGEGLFHICFEVDDIDDALSELKRKGVKLIDEQPRAGHANSRIAFIDSTSTGNVLIELVELEKSPRSFGRARGLQTECITSQPGHWTNQLKGSSRQYDQRYNAPRVRLR